MKIFCTTVNFLLLFLLCAATTSSKGTPKKKVKEDIKNYEFPPCAGCRMLVESFKKGMERTERGKFEGGDTDWEENKLGSYKTSELRLVEIQDKLCEEVDQGQSQCYTLAEEHESDIEEWWFKKQDSDPILYDYLCITVAQKCCPKNHYGPNCDPCTGYPDNVCNNNGKCKGSGTRKGNGKCTCDTGYTGEACFECSDGFYQSYKDEKKLLCSPCHKACKSTCTGGGAKECKECNPGWRSIEGKGCYDIDECNEKEDSCPDNHFCVNNEGNYTCLACDKSCEGCFGDGPDMCNKCAEGYKKKDNMCMSTSTQTLKTSEDFYRYARYLGLSVATGIILQKNIYAAAVIGLCVAIYITVSEYSIAHSGPVDPTPSIDLGKFPK